MNRIHDRNNNAGKESDPASLLRGTLIRRTWTTKLKWIHL
jgi:hypothetical protein